MPEDDVPGSDERDGDEVTRLRGEVQSLQQQLDQHNGQTTQVIEPPPGRAGRRGRSVASFILILVAVLLAPVTVVGVFAVSQVNDTERYVATVGPLAADPDVQERVADLITNKIFQEIDLDEIISATTDLIGEQADLSPRASKLLDALGGPLESGIEGFTRDQVQTLVQSEVFANAWAAANRVAHTQLLALLRGDDDGALTTSGGQVSLNLGEVVAEVQSALVQRGFTVAERLPQIDAQYVIYQSDDVATLQAWYRVADAVGYWLPIVVILLAIGGVLAANNRRRAIVWLGCGLLASMVALSVIVAAGRAGYLAALPPESDPDVAATVYDQVLRFLVEGLRSAALVGAILALAAVAAGPSTAAVTVRGWARGAAARTSGGLASLGVPVDSIAAPVARFATAARIVFVVLAIVAALLPQYTTVAVVLWTMAALLLALFVLQVLVAPAVRPADPDADREQAAPAETG